MFTRISDRKNKWRRRTSLGLVDPDPLFMLLVVGLLAALLAPGALRAPDLFMWGSVGLMALGSVCIAIFKISFFWKDSSTSIESQSMTKPYTLLSKIGYILLGTGFFLFLLVFRPLFGF